MEQTDNAEFRETFAQEAKEHLLSVEDDILALERQGSNVDAETVTRLLRVVHTIKGSAGFLKLTKITELAHELENVIGPVSKGKLVPDERTVDSLLRGLDKLNELADAIDDEGAVDTTAEIETLKQILGQTPQPPPVAERVKTERVAVRQASPAEVIDASPFDLSDYNLASVRDESLFVFDVTIDLIAECRDKDRPFPALKRRIESIGRLLAEDLAPESTKDLSKSSKDHIYYSFLLAAAFEEEEVLTKGLGISPSRLIIHRPENLPVRRAPAADSRPSHEREKPPVKRRATETSVIRRLVPAPVAVSTQTRLKISLPLLDKLMGLAGELVLVRNQNLQALAAGDYERMNAIFQRLNVVTSDLQTGIMQTRMQPVSIVFNKYTRFVRDLAKSLGKEADLEIIGGDVELDKTIIEAIGDPLTHLIRNSLDHGIEFPDVRESLGKPRRGRIVLRAFHRGGQVHIQIEDDGAGIDPSHIRGVALEKGFISQEQYGTMSDEEAEDLIFVSGFSTAKHVTEVSGRGVGMDVVKSELQRLSGVVVVSSIPDKRTIVTVTLPLTLAILSSLTVKAKDYYFSIPQVNVTEIVWLYGDDVRGRIDEVNGREVFTLRGKLLPLMRLCEILGIEDTYIDPETKILKRGKNPVKDNALNRKSRDEIPALLAAGKLALEDSVYIVVLKHGNDNFGVVVDEIVDTEEIVIKPLHDQLHDCEAFAGTAVLGSGRLTMLLDITGVAKLGGLQTGVIESPEPEEKWVYEDRHPCLLFDIAGSETFAAPLALLSRVEKISAADIQRAGKREFITLGDRVLPLVYLDSVLNSISGEYGNELHVLVPKCGKPAGIVVSNILDARDVECNLDSDTFNDEGITGSTLIDGRLVLFLDVIAVLEKFEPGWCETEDSDTEEKKPKILLLEDSTFTANLFAGHLRAAGAEVVHVLNGADGLDEMAKHDFDFIVSDIEMPVMGGLEFARRVREKPEYQGLPMIAISSLEEKSAKDKARRAGFDAFRSKLDRESVTETLTALAKGVRMTELRGDDGIYDVRP